VDPDPGGPKTCGSGGFGSGTLPLELDLFPDLISQDEPTQSGFATIMFFHGCKIRKENKV
jgi:hypothetical protein